MKLENSLRNDFSMYIRPLLLKDKCEICGGIENLELHHEKQFVELLKDTLDELNFNIMDEDILNKNEIYMIRNIMLGKQLKYDYKTICSDCHGKIKNKNNLVRKKKHRKYTGEQYKNMKIKRFLNKHIDKILSEEEKYILIHLINLTDNRNRLLSSLSKLNSYIQEHYEMSIVSNQDKRKLIKDKHNSNYNKTYWKIVKGIESKNQ